MAERFRAVAMEIHSLELDNLRVTLHRRALSGTRLGRLAPYLRATEARGVESVLSFSGANVLWLPALVAAKLTRLVTSRSPRGRGAEETVELRVEGGALRSGPRLTVGDAEVDLTDLRAVGVLESEVADPVQPLWDLTLLFEERDLELVTAAADLHQLRTVGRALAEAVSVPFRESSMSA